MLVKVAGIYIEMNRLAEDSIERAVQHVIMEVSHVWPDASREDQRKAALNIFRAYVEQLK